MKKIYLLISKSHHNKLACRIPRLRFAGLPLFFAEETDKDFWAKQFARMYNQDMPGYDFDIKPARASDKWKDLLKAKPGLNFGIYHSYLYL